MFFYEIWVRRRVGPKSQSSAMLAAKLVLEGSAGEAACRGRERVGVLKIEEHSA